MTSIKTAFNQAANSYDKHCHLQTLVGAKLLNLLNQYTFTSPRIIDLGCGTGIVTKKLIETFTFDSLHAIDFADHLLMKASQRLSHPNIQIYHADFDRLPKYPEPFDIIFSNMALHWSADFNTMLGLIHSQLNQKGMLAFSMPLAGTFIELTPHFATNSFLSQATITHLLEKNEYEILTKQSEKISMQFESTTAALRYIKNTGAHYVSQRTFSGLRGKSYVQSINIHTLTYHIGYFVVCKKGSLCQSNYLSPAPTPTLAKHMSVSDC